MRTHVQLAVHQNPHVIFCKTAFYAANSLPLLLHEFIPSALRILRLITSYTSKDRLLLFEPKQFSGLSTWFQFSTESYSPPKLLQADNPWLLKNALFSVGKHIITLLYFLLLQQPICLCCFSPDILLAVLVLGCLTLTTGVETL